MLELLNGHNLMEANKVICDKYKAELNALRDPSNFVADLDEGVALANFRNISELAMIKFRQNAGLLPKPFEGPSLQHRPGTLKWTVPTNMLR